MYTRCIYCSAELGRNEAVEEFPVGRTLAFDAARGRLWAVCAKCRRWNLAPIEERWEAVEELEKRFRDTRLKVQSENVGLSKSPDGTRLVRVGQALPGELAAWRYGEQFAGRRRKYLATAAGSVAVMGAFAATNLFGMVALSPIVLPVLYGWTIWRSRSGPEKRLAGVVHRGLPLLVRAKHLHESHIERPIAPGERFSLRLRVPHPHPFLSARFGERTEDVRLTEASAVRVLRRGMVHVNQQGARPEQLRDALRLLGEQDVDAYLRRLPSFGRQLMGARKRDPLDWIGADAPLPPEVRLALEMALHEEDERRALEGELTALEAAWREAEEIAAIADALPNVPPPLPPNSPHAPFERPAGVDGGPAAAPCDAGTSTAANGVDAERGAR